MLSSFKTYVAERKRGLTTAAGFVGGIYFANRYIKGRLEDVKDKLEREQAARDVLKRRFQQTQDDISYTVLALLPTLADQILETMDVEALTQELQTRSKARNTRQHLRPPSSLASSVDMLQEQEIRSDTGSVAPSVASTSFSLAEAPATTTPSAESNANARSGVGMSESAGELLSASVITTGTRESPVPVESMSADGSRLSDNLMSSSIISESTDTRTKAELWTEVKMLTFTRTLTVLYSTTLFCLLETIQLTLLARSKYVNAILQQERDEQMRERLESELSLSRLLFSGGKGIEDLISGDPSAFLDDIPDDVVIPEEVENKFLTLSWWLLHVGWKDVGERVRRGVEEVFEGVALKTKLSITDLHRLINDVRRRVEHEITFEGNERRTNFLSTLLPPTPEMIQHVLTQGGFPAYAEEPSAASTTQDKLTMDSSTSLSSSQLSHSNYLIPALNNAPDPLATLIHHPDTYTSASASDILPTRPLPNPHPHTADLPFTNLLNETREIICSSDFAAVLENCLDKATEVLFNGLERNVFVDSEQKEGEGDVRIRLAGLLPGLSRWSSLALRGVPCESVDNVLAVREVPRLSAIVFAKFEERFR